MTAQTVPLSALGRISPAEFTALLGAVYEHSPWVAERALGLRGPTGFSSRAEVHASLVASVYAASAEEQRALLNAHPELAGRETSAGALTAASLAEQTGAGLTAMSADDVTRLRDLNARYRERFGFPFIVAVRNHTQAAIFGSLEARLHNTPTMEFNNALAQVCEIARLRLFDLIEA